MREGLPDEATILYVQASSTCPKCGQSHYVGKGFKRTCSSCGRSIVALDRKPRKLYEITEQELLDFA